MNISVQKENILPALALELPPELPVRARTVRYTGAVTRVQNERVLASIGRLVDQAPEEDIGLFVTSPGGATGTAMSFYDSIRHVLTPRLVSIGSGEVDSSGIIVFLAGGRRYVSARTTALLHPAGRIFGNQRYTTREMAAMLEEDRLKDAQYARVVAENSRGALSPEDVLGLMEAHTTLSPEDLLRYGLIDGILA